MGRIFETRKHKMFARWSRNAKAFTKIGKEIAVAVKLGGGDPAGNPRLRMAIQTSRALNMPKDRVDAAIKRAISKDSESLSEVVYEGYGPNGVALVVETATDNPTRTVANVRSIFADNGGALGSTGSLAYLFGMRGVFVIDTPTGDMDEFELEMIDHGLEEIFQAEQGFIVYSSFENFGALQRALEEKKIEIKSAALQRFAHTPLDVTPELLAKIEKFIEELEEDDDVQHVYHNMKVE